MGGFEQPCLQCLCSTTVPNLESPSSMHRLPFPQPARYFQTFNNGRGWIRGVCYWPLFGQHYRRSPVSDQIFQYDIRFVPHPVPIGLKITPDNELPWKQKLEDIHDERKKHATECATAVTNLAAELLRLKTWKKIHISPILGLGIANIVASSGALNSSAFSNCPAETNLSPPR
ncbi:predicted protein [Histoplasma capsulatum var. duboisii H88]|uniref:Predicted protein n=1 Tax=Ajellomyces capsulatus (strain H88) TaxID=544711 RepID=F0UP00_AJEC8|nr:predicted protein [Histoplasma capsulatum var. duboisii H88]